MTIAQKGLLITHYTLVDSNPYGCIFVLNDETQFMDRFKVRFGGVVMFLPILDEVNQFIEDCRYKNGDYMFYVAQQSYVIYIHHYLVSFATIDSP